MSFTARSMLGLSAAAAAVCLSAAGCGSPASPAGTASRAGTAAGQPDPLASLTAKQIAAKAISDLKSAPAFTMAGTAPVDGQETTMSIAVKSGGCAMTVDMGPKGSMTMLIIGNTAWMKADATFWKANAGAAGSSMTSMFAGKYVKLPASASSGLTKSVGTCNVNQMTSSSSSIPIPTDTAKGAITTVNGQRVYPLTDKAKEVTMYVTDTSTPQIIKIVSAKPGDSGQMSISYGVPKPITAPPASETVTMPGF